MEFDLSMYVGQTVWLGFRYSTDGNTNGPGIWVDDIHPVQTWTTSNIIDSNIVGTSYSVNDQTPGSYWYTLRGLDAEGDWGYLSDYAQTVVESITSPASYNLFRGNLVSGTLADVVSSDDVYVDVNPGFTTNSDEAPVWLTFNGTLPNDSPGSLVFRVESAANTPNITQTVEMLNWTTGEYVEVETIETGFVNDSIQTIDLSPFVSEYVRSGTGEVNGRVGYRITGFAILYPWTISVDEVVWLTE